MTRGLVAILGTAILCGCSATGGPNDGPESNLQPVDSTVGKQRLLGSTLVSPATMLAGSKPRNSGDNDQLIARFNHRVALVETLWCEMEVFCSWKDDSGNHFESGEGILAFQSPSYCAFCLMKVGETYLWIGCNSELAWMFWCRNGPKSAEDYNWVVRKENVGRECCDATAARFVQPEEFAPLVGLSIVPQQETRVSAVSLRDRGSGWVLECAGPYGTIRRTYIDQREELPRYVEIVDAKTGEVLITSELLLYQVLPGYQVSLPSFMSADSGPLDFHLNLRVKAIDTGPIGPDGKAEPIGAQVFEFAAVRRSMHPEGIKVLDANCPRPAIPAQSEQ